MPALLDYPPVLIILLGPLTLYMWGIFAALGVLLASAIAVRRARRAGLSPEHVWRAAFWIVLAGIAGARLLFLAEYGRVTGELYEIVAIWEGGLSAFGALGGGILVGWWYIHRHRLSLRQTAWAAAPAVLLGDAVGRLGGAASHMYPGTPTAFALSYMLDGVQRHEVGMELALASLLGFVVLAGMEHRWRNLTRRPHVIVALALGWYCLERLLLDFFRASDLPASDLRYWGLPPVASAEGGLTLAQILAAFGIVAAIAVFAAASRKSPQTARSVSQPLTRVL